MKIFNLYKSIGVLALAITLLTSCSEDQYWNDNPLNDPTAPSTLPALTSGNADFSNYVSLGASFSAGEISGSVFIKSQEYSFPNLLAEAFSNTVTLTDAGTEGFFSQPMVNDNIGGFGVASDNFSYWDQDSDELLAKGNGGTRQMYNYATVDYKTSIETPPDDWSPDKVSETSYNEMEEQRNNDLRMQQMNKPAGI